MAGGIIQLFAYGAEDIYLTGSPQITFFKTVYRRHTNFSIETFERKFTDGPDFGKKNTTKIFRLGDLATKMVLKVTVKSITPNEGARFAWVRRLGHALINCIKIEIGGQCIDKQYGTWLDIWWELARTGSHERGYFNMIGDVPIMTEFNDKKKPHYDLFIPLKFWFNRFQGLALPLIAIQYHEIFINIEFAPFQRLVVTSTNFDNFHNIGILEASLLIDYVYLDKDERERFASVGHEYLIEQVQYTGEENIEVFKKKFLLQFNYPTKELIWAMKNGNFTSGKKFLCYTHEDDWSEEIKRCSKKLLEDSIILLNGPTFKVDQYGNFVLDQYGNRIIEEPGTSPPPGEWEEFQPMSEGTTMNGKVTVNVQSHNMSLWVNTNSLKFGDYSITNNITADLQVSPENFVLINNIISTISERDISFSTEDLEDTRINSSGDICVNQFSNYGVLITGRFNPIEYALLEFNDQERFKKRNGKFFNYLQPEMHHNNTPADGINVYSFSLEPEKHQPTGTANLSRVERIILTIWFGDNSQTYDLPNINFINLNSRFFIFGLNYNVLKIMNGLSVLAYTN